MMAGSRVASGTSTIAIVRQDSIGDVLLAGPAVRAVAHAASRTVFVASPSGASAAALLPGVDEVLSLSCPWIQAQPINTDRAMLLDLCERLAAAGIDRAIILTSAHQSPLPTALMLRMAGVPWIGALSVDYAGSLLDLRIKTDPGDVPESVRALSIARACGFALPAEDAGKLALRQPLPDVSDLINGLAAGSFVAVHPGTSVPARSWPDRHFAELVHMLTAHGIPVAVTGDRSERGLTSRIAGTDARDLGGRTSLAQLAAVFAAAAVTVVANTGPAHLAAAVGASIVSLFAPTVPTQRWAPQTDRLVVLGDQSAPCAGTRVRECHVPGHPCLSSVTAPQAFAAVRQLMEVS